MQEKVDGLETKKTEAEKKAAEENSAKGVVKQDDKYAEQVKGKENDPKFYEENVKEITKEHRETMDSIREGKMPRVDNTFKGFAEMVNLQAQANNQTAGMNFEHPADEMMHKKLLEKGKGDIIVPRKID